MYICICVYACIYIYIYIYTPLEGIPFIRDLPLQSKKPNRTGRTEPNKTVLLV